MAELVSNKSANLVSNNVNMKNNDVCGVQSSNGLIELDNTITTSNNHLTTMCDDTEDDDDLTSAKNTKNDPTTDDKSLQEMIESELALRICSANDHEELSIIEDDEEDPTTKQPEITIKKIILEPRQHTLDINAEFIGAEMQHYEIVQDPYTYRNGHEITNSEDPRLSKIPKSRENDDELATIVNYDDDTVQGQTSDLRVSEESVMSRENSMTTRLDDDIVEDEILVRSECQSDRWSNSEAFEFVKTTSHVIRSENDVEMNVNAGKIVGKVGNDDDTEGGRVNDKWNDDSIGKLMVENSVGGSLAEEGEVLMEPVVWQEHLIRSDDNNAIGQFSDDFGVVQGRSEPEEPEEDQHPESSPLDFQLKFHETIIDNDCDENSRAEADTDIATTNHRDEGSTNVNVDGKFVVEESKNHLDNLGEGQANYPGNSDEDCEILTGDDDSRRKSSISRMNENRRDVDDEEAVEATKSRKNNEETTMNDEDGTGKTILEEGDDCLRLDKDVRVFGEGVDEYSSTNGLQQDDEQVERESSWMTVEEATNDRNKFPETVNDRTNEISDVDRATKVEDKVKKSESVADRFEESFKVERINGHVSSVNVDAMGINFVGSNVKNDDEDDDEDVDDDDDDENGDRDDNEITFDGKICNSFLKESTMTMNVENCLIIDDGDVNAPLATPDDEIAEFSNVCDKEIREEVITSSTVVTSSSTTSTKTSTKTKKKKIEGVAGNDASTNLTPRTKKTKKSKKNDLEKENISVNINAEDQSMRTASRQMSQDMDDFSNDNDLSNVNVKSLTKTYVSETSRGEQEKSNKEIIETGVSIKQLCRSFGDISNMTDVDQVSFGISEQTTETHEKAKSMDDLRLCQRNFKKFARDATVFVGVSVKALKSSFNKFDALSKKSVLNVRSVDSGKTQQQLNSAGQNGDASANCRSCGKVVFQMEQTKAEGLIWHKNCFRCVQCSKQLNVDNYQSHESTLYCKAHFKELFQPKPVEESDQPVRPRKPEMIIRENQPKELPPDVVRASDKPDLGLEELSSLNVKSRFQVFEKTTNDTTNEIERSPSQVVKRSPSILSKLAKFQAKGMDIGVADDSLNGIPYEESSESEEEEEIEESEELDNEIIKSKRTTRERPISFTKMDDIKNRWECTSQQGRRESQREARKEEIAGIRSRLFMGKQGKMKEMYQQAVAESERVTKINPTEEIQHSTHARSIKESFERGEPIATSDGEDDSKPKQEKPDEEVIAAGISRKSRSLFLELDASAAKTGRPVTPVNPKTPTDVSRRARDAFMGRQVSDDVVRSTDTTEEVQVETSDISNKFKFFETYQEPTKERKQFRITPPRDGLVKQMGSPEREIYRDPDVVRADDRVDEVVHTDTARKMLSIFRQMEEKATKEDIPDGPKPLKRFTPPPEDKFAKATASESEDEGEEEGEESEGEDSGEEKDPNYVRASDKVEDEFLKQAQNAARAKTLRAKFEHWEETDGKVTSHHVAEMDMAQGNGDQASIESASSLRARFESLGSQPSDSPRTPKVKVNRFVEIQTICMDVCESCQKKVYPLEKVETNNKIFHKQCFRCLQCNCVLRMDTFTLNNGKLYCIPHFKQLFIARGNYDEGFGVDPHKNKWSANNANSTGATTNPTIAVSNGRANTVANRV